MYVLKQVITVGCNDKVNFKGEKNYRCILLLHTAVKDMPFFRRSQFFKTLLLPLKLFDFVLRSLFAALQTSPGGDDKAHFNDVYTAASG